MPIINKEFKNDKEWHDWRNLGIGASEVPIIMGLSPYISTKRHFLDRLNLTRRFLGNRATEYGKEREPIIREKAIKEIGFEILPGFAEYGPWNVLRASLDGYSAEKNVIVEIKTCSDESLLSASRGIIPPHYMAQMQAQLMCSEAAYGIYVAESHSQQIVLNRVEHDKEMQKNIDKYCSRFWLALSSAQVIDFKGLVSGLNNDII